VARVILGVSALYHDAAAALLIDGQVVAAAQEERFTRLKHDPSLPVRAAGWCLRHAGLRVEDIDQLVFYEKPLRKFERILTTSVAAFPRSALSFPRQMKAWLGDKLWTRNRLVEAFGVPSAKIGFSEHHLSHAASAFYSSPFERAAVLVADGVGEWATTSIWRGGPEGLTPLAEVRWPHSLGLVYSALTAFLGFAVNEGEYKVMGMAAWGQPRYLEQLHQIAKLTPGGGFALDLDVFSHHWHPTRATTARLEALLGPPRAPGSPIALLEPGADAAARAESQRHADIAASTQRWLEDALLHVVRHAHALSGEDALCLAGGVALNAVANHRLAAEGPFARLFVQPAAGDAGGALGAAQWAAHAVFGQPRPAGPFRVDLGPEIDVGHARQLAEDLGFPHAEVSGEDQLAAGVAADLLAGRAVGFVQGRAELGPRALGHRSILADPRGAGTAERVNRQIKLREPFRPFAPSARAADMGLFEVPPAAADLAPYMVIASPAADRLRAEAPAVVHVDGTARPQAVDPGQEPLYHAVLEQLHAATGLGVALNTSFNLKGEPLVGSATDALATLARSGLDAVWIGPLRIGRPSARALGE
jgi:carbamoyltransferase